MKITKSPNIKKYIDRVDSPLDALSANEIITDIQLRTQSGQDSNKQAFRKYTNEYAKQKGSSKVNLTATNKMLNNISWKKINNYTLRIFFSSAHERSKAHGNQYKNGRKFFGIDKDQVKDINKRLRAYLLK